MNPDCRLQFFDQGKPVERGIAFSHGYHGLADRMTREHELLTTEEMVEFDND